MPNRLIRSGILESEAVLSLTIEARWLYVSILLSADDLGLFEATPFRLARIADVKREHAERLLQQLVDADLVRLYQVDHRQLGFIPRFGQRLQIQRAKHPLPARSLLQGDTDALAKFDLLSGSNAKKAPNEINDLGRNPTVGHGSPRFSTVGQPPEPEPEPEVIPLATSIEVARPRPLAEDRQPDLLGGKAGPEKPERPPDCPHLDVLALWAQVLPSMPQHEPDLWGGARADNLRARWRETAAKKGWRSKQQGIDYFRRFFEYIGTSPFLTGRAGQKGDRRPFQAELEWVVKPGNWAKIHEGKYHNEG